MNEPGGNGPIGVVYAQLSAKTALADGPQNRIVGAIRHTAFAAAGKLKAIGLSDVMVPLAFLITLGMLFASLAMLMPATLAITLVGSISGAMGWVASRFRLVSLPPCDANPTPTHAPNVHNEWSKKAW